MAQLLVQVITVTNLAPGATVTVAHDLESNGAAVAPTLVIADRATSIAVQSVSTTGVTFINNGSVASSANFRCERGWQPEVDASTVTTMLWGGGGGSSAAGVVSKVFSLTAAVSNFGFNTTGVTFFSPTIAIPASTFTTGSTVQFRVSGVTANATGAGLNTTIQFWADADGVAPGTGALASTGVIMAIPNAQPFSLIANATIKAAGNNVGALGGVLGSFNVFNVAGSNDTANGINTQAVINLAMSVNFSVADNNNFLAVNNFEVYICR